MTAERKFEMKDKTRKWIKAAAVRAVKTMAQVAIAAIGTATLFTDVNLATVGLTTVLAGVLSVLTSTAGLPEVEE